MENTGAWIERLIPPHMRNRLAEMQSSLDQPSASERIGAMMEARGKIVGAPPRAGEAF